MEKVCARIAHLGDDQALTFQDGCGKRGAHALAANALRGRLDDVEVRGNHGTRQRVGVGVVGSQLSDGVDGDFRGNLAGFVAAHTVGDGEQRRYGNQAVFVVLAHMANFRAASEEGYGVGAICGFALGARIAGSGHSRIHLPLLLGEPYAHGHIADGNLVAVLERGGFRDKAAVYGCAVGGA